jgi:nicotinate-nucleotide adenylyltransferase
MKVGLYFGSFNPIHTGHCIIANHVAYNTDIEQVWLIVSPQNPFKISASLLNEYHRLHLAQRAIENDVKLKVSDIEFHLPKPSYTVETLTYLAEKYPQHEFAIIMGSDSFQNISKWKNAEYIISNYDIYVYNRSGHTENNIMKARLKVLDAPLLEISSTRIREYIRTKKSIRFLVPDSVVEEIEANGYYK